MHLGMPTLMETNTLEECAKLCHELELHFIELNMNLPQYQSERIDTRELLHIAEKYDLYYTVHLDEDFNPCAFNQSVADAYLKTAMRTINIAKTLAAPVINLHMADGVYFTMPTERIYLFRQYKEDYLRGLIALRDKAEQAIGKSGILMCVENSGIYQDFQIEGIDVLLKSPAFALTFDVGHSRTHGGADETVIRKRQNRLRHMHLHDVLGKNNHLALGTGELDLIPYISLAKEQNCRIVLETKTILGLKQSVRYMRNHVNH